MNNATDWHIEATQYSIIKESRRDIVFPFLLDQLRLIKPSNLLDYGGGDGNFINLCAGLSISELFSYDPALDMGKLARKANHHNSRVKILDDLTGIQPIFFDVITFNAVWMCLHDWESCVNVLSNINKYLRDGGLLIASVTHPCFRSEKFANYFTNFNMKNYLANGTEFSVTIHDQHNSFDIVDTHWNLTAMTKQLNETGFLIQELIELPDLNMPSTSGTGSPWLILKALKATG